MHAAPATLAPIATKVSFDIVDAFTKKVLRTVEAVSSDSAIYEVLKRPGCPTAIIAQAKR